MKEMEKEASMIDIWLRRNQNKVEQSIVRKYRIYCKRVKTIAGYCKQGKKKLP